MIGVKVCGFLAERFFVTDGNIAAYVNKMRPLLSAGHTVISAAAAFVTGLARHKAAMRASTICL